MNKRKEICGRCAELMKQSGRKLILVHRGVDRKIFCTECNRRRYGGTYEEVIENA